MIADMLINKKPNPIVTEYLLEVGNISLFLLHNFIFLFQKNIRHYCTFYCTI